MCLSTVYEELDGQRSKVCEYGSRVKAGENGLVLTDIMGREITVNGTLKSMDFIKNEIIVEGA